MDSIVVNLNRSYFYGIDGDSCMEYGLCACGHGQSHE